MRKTAILMSLFIFSFSFVRLADGQEEVKSQPSFSAIKTQQGQLNIVGVDKKGETFNFSDLAFRQIDGSENGKAVDSPEGKFDEGRAVYFIKNSKEGINLSEGYLADSFVIFFPKDSADKYEEASVPGTKVILRCVYEDKETKLDGLIVISNMRINGRDAVDRKVKIQGSTVEFVRKHTKSEVHIYGLKPGEYFVEFDAEATFNGKFFKTSGGTAKFKVAGEKEFVRSAVFKGNR